MTAVPLPRVEMELSIPNGFVLPLEIVSMPGDAVQPSLFIGGMPGYPLKFVPSVGGLFTFQDAKGHRLTVEVASYMDRVVGYLITARICIYGGVVVADPAPVLINPKSRFMAILTQDRNVKRVLASLIGQTGEQVVASGWAQLDAAWTNATQHPSLDDTQDPSVPPLFVDGWS